MSQPDFNPAFATTWETAAALRARTISARELLAMTYQRIDRHNPALKAIVWQDRERAMVCATQADKVLAAGTPSGAFLGVPVTIKESFAYR
jgi:amidase